MSKRQFNKVWTGGTFDHFHEGHRELLNTAFDAGDYVVIGITTNERVKNKRYSELIHGLLKVNIELDRKSLSEMAIHDPEAFDAVVAEVKATLAA